MGLMQLFITNTRLSDNSVLHFISGVKYIECAIVVRYDNHPRAMLVGNAAKEFHDLPPSVAIQCGSRFIGENYARLVRQRSGDGNSLLLPT